MNKTNRNRMYRIKADKQDKKKYLSKKEFLMVKGNQATRKMALGHWSLGKEEHVIRVKAVVNRPL